MVILCQLTKLKIIAKPTENGPRIIRNYEWNFHNYMWVLWSWTSLFLIQVEWIHSGHPHTDTGYVRTQITLILHNTFLFFTFFINRVINTWNKLPSDVVLTRTLNCFKNLLEKVKTLRTEIILHKCKLQKQSSTIICSTKARYHHLLVIVYTKITT